MYFHFFSGIQSDNSIIENFLVKTAVFGQTGVLLFFVLSGFLITRILLSAKDNVKYFSHFYIRRSLRIFPLYYLALCIYFLTASLIQQDAPSTPSLTWYYWPYLQNIAMTFNLNISGPSHFWSLAVEEHFYLFWPVIIFYAPAKRLPVIIGLIVICTIILRFILFHNGLEVFYFTGTTMDALAIGAILAVKEKNNSLLKRSLSSYLCVFSLIITTTVVLWLYSGGKGLLFIQAFKGTLVACVYYLLLSFIINLDKGSLFKKLLNHKLLLFTGKISYGLYVYHVLCFSLYLKYFTTSYLLIDFLSCLVLSYVVASLSYFLFEVRFLRLKDNLTSKSDSVVPAFSLQ